MFGCVPDGCQPGSAEGDPARFAALALVHAERDSCRPCPARETVSTAGTCDVAVGGSIAGNRSGARLGKDAGYF